MKDLHGGTMNIEKLENGRLGEICDAWLKDGAPEGELNEFRIYGSEPRIDCYAVVDTGTILAIFEMRDAGLSYKNMSILFAPSIDIAEAEYSIVSKQIGLIINVVTEIFSHFIADPLENRGKLKIWNDRLDIRSILIDFAKYLSVNFGEMYDVKIYRKWVDIQKKGE